MNNDLRLKSGCDTPVLCLDFDGMRRNLQRMADFFSTTPAKLRPHFKTHKSPLLARFQIEAGAIGMTCAKIGEAEVLAAGGIRDILIANQAVGPEKIRRLLALALTADVKVAVEDPRNVRDIAEAAAARGLVQKVIIEVDVGMGRCGTLPGEETLDLVGEIKKHPGLLFAGIMGYEGHAVFIADPAERRRAAETAMRLLTGTKDLIEKNGQPVEIVSAGGTGTHMFTARYPGVTEVQAGSYLTMDGRYAALPDMAGFETPMTILASVISVRGDRAVIDAGIKSVTSEFGTPRILRPAGWELDKLSEEHGSLKNIGGGPLKPGDRVEILPSHGCTTINLHDSYHVFRGERLEAEWPIAGRGKVR
jgi:D-serine deaminase-like pyridoxal phosphate-dependent protein